MGIDRLLHRQLSSQEGTGAEFSEITGGDMKKQTRNLWLAALFICIFSHSFVRAQNSEIVELELEATPLFSEARMIEYLSLAFDESGRGARIFSLILQNTSRSELTDIYIEYSVRSSRSGMLFEAYQSADTPITLQAGQILAANNNDLASAQLPGIPPPIYFFGDLTSGGRSLLNSVRGSTLPADAYTLTMNIYQYGNEQTGGNLLTTESITIGENLADGELSVFLISPGDIPGSNISISNPYPDFRWEGRLNQTYRLIIVEGVEGESAPSLIESALSTHPAREGGTTNLLQFEQADILVNGTSFQYPPSGVQSLQPGQTYFWQVFSTLRSTSGEKILSSEIWSFTLDGGGTSTGPGGENIPIENDILALLYAILGEQKTNELIGRGFNLEAIQLDENEFRGISAREQLEELLLKVREGTVKFTHQPQ